MQTSGTVRVGPDSNALVILLARPSAIEPMRAMNAIPTPLFSMMRTRPAAPRFHRI
ncbi:hypothetical protein L810_7483 [Burkholderia sp. AU4i]|nr:hypothetical protein L810_7483 [Burkholderia sp. AU4i]MDW9247028.1 hypothetical protein [Burkholderia cepacia]QOH37362.1 hypothetical protein C7S14_2889 [Burkholderia cepacia]